MITFNIDGTDQYAFPYRYNGLDCYHGVIVPMHDNHSANEEIKVSLKKYLQNNEILMENYKLLQELPDRNQILLQVLNEL